MSDDVPVISLEDDDDAPAVAAPAPAPVAAPATDTEPAAPVTEPEEIDPNAVDLHDEARVRGLLAELSRQRGVVRDLKPRAERAQQLEQEIAAARPYVQFLQANPGLMQPHPPAPPTPADPAEDPDALAAAQLYDFYTPEGKPDTVKGAAHLRMVEKAAQRIASAAVQPYAQQSQQERSNANYQAVLQMKDANGQTPSPEAVTAVWRQMLSEPNGLAITSDQRSAAFLAMAALGIDRMTKRPPGPLPGPVLETEPAGGAPQGRVPMTTLEEKIAKDRGRKPAEWQALTKGFQSGRPSNLED